MNMTTGRCQSDSGVRQDCPLSPLLFNIYVRELGKVISNCAHGVKRQSWKRMVSGNVRMKQGFYTQMIDVCLMASSEDDMKVIMKQVKECVIEYGLKVNEKKSKVVYTWRSWKT